MHSKSLRFRLLIAEGLVLAIFFALVALILEQGFRDTAEEALQERLQIQIYSLLAAAKVETNGELAMPDELPDPRFATPGSGLYGFIQQAPAKLVWQSPSAIGLEVESPEQLEIDQFKFLFEKKKIVAYCHAVKHITSSKNTVLVNM